MASKASNTPSGSLLWKLVNPFDDQPCDYDDDGSDNNVDNNDNHDDNDSDDDDPHPSYLVAVRRSGRTVANLLAAAAAAARAAEDREVSCQNFYTASC